MNLIEMRQRWEGYWNKVLVFEHQKEAEIRQKNRGLSEDSIRAKLNKCVARKFESESEKLLNMHLKM